MSITWLTICNATKANIYDITRAKHDGRWKSPLLKVLEHPEGRMKGAELITDKAGDYKAGDYAGGKFIQHATPHEVQLEQFAKQIASFLENERANQHFHSLIICSDPHFQGILEKHLPLSLKHVIKRHIQKNYVPLEADKSHKLEKVIQAIQQEQF